MVSVVVCSCRGPRWADMHERNIRVTTAGCNVEYIRIDNRVGDRGICAVYNEGVRWAQGDIVVFVHEDVFFMEPGWPAVLERKFIDTTIGLVGVAGTQWLFADDLRWHIGGPPFTRGRVVHELNDGAVYVLTVFSWDKADAQVVVADGLFLAIRRSLFERISFDEQHFPGFHFYDLDICMQVNQTHRCIVTWDILLKHLSGGKLDASWFLARDRFKEKYRDRLPASCTTATPLDERRGTIMSYDLRGRVPGGIMV